MLGIDALKDFVAAVYAYLPNVLAAVLIFLVAGAIAGGVAALASRTMGDTTLGKIIATVAPILVMTIATFMILEQLKIAHDIVVTTYTLVLGAVALASALAFGLGGREVAGQLLQGAYEKGQENKEQFKRDLDQGVNRAKEEAQARRSCRSRNDGRRHGRELVTVAGERLLPRRPRLRTRLRRRVRPVIVQLKGRP